MILLSQKEIARKAPWSEYPLLRDLRMIYTLLSLYRYTYTNTTIPLDISFCQHISYADSTYITTKKEGFLHNFFWIGRIANNRRWFVIKKKVLRLFPVPPSVLTSPLRCVSKRSFPPFQTKKVSYPPPLDLFALSLPPLLFTVQGET